jgi:hypothetical protein
MALSYVQSVGGRDLELGDIKYLSAYSKDGGYVVNIQAGDALCEMPMIKGDKEWMARGISCNGSFLSEEKAIERSKARLARDIKKNVDEFNTQAPRTTEHGVRMNKASFDGKRYAMDITLPVTAAELPEDKKIALADGFTKARCNEKLSKEALEAGYTLGVDVSSSDNKSILSLTLSNDDCFK